MSEKKLFSFDFLESFQNRDTFFEKIMDEQSAGHQLLKHLLMLTIFGAIYGIVMGCYNGWEQAISSGLKVPILFILIILICFPAFFVIQAILGSKLTLGQMFSVIISGFMMTTSIMVSFAPIVFFFLITGDNYGFIKLLHVAIFTLASLFGMRFIIDALKFSCEKKAVYPKTGVQVFKFWIIILAFVGAQLSWSLRPFVGAKDRPFQIFREQEGNFYQAVVESVGDMFTGKDSK